MTTKDEQATHRQMIEERIGVLGVPVAAWEFDSVDRRIIARLGTWAVLDEQEDRGLYDGDEGEMHATVVGAPQYNNLRVAFYFAPEGHTDGMEVEPFEDVEPV